MNSQCVICKHYMDLSPPREVEPYLKSYERFVPWQRDCRINAHYRHKITEVDLCPEFDEKEAKK